MRKIKLLFIVLGEISSGELSMAMSFADELDDTFEKSFVVCNIHKKQLSGENSKIYYLYKSGSTEQNRDEFMKVIDAEKPDAVLLFDIFTFKYAQVWTGLSIDVLKKLGLPLMSIDEYNYSEERSYIDYYGNKTKTNFANLLKYCDMTFTNCPLSSCKKLMKKDQFLYRLYRMQDFEQVTAYDAIQIRKKYLLKTTAKIIFLATSYWELAYFNPKVKLLQKWIPRILKNYLSQINGNIIVVHVSSRPWEMLAEIKNIEYVYYPVLSSKQFQELLKISNLFITFNITSVTLTKAILLRIPSLLLHNPTQINFNKFTEKLKNYPEWFQEMAGEMEIAEPFEASVFGWHNFLKPILEDNEYLETFESASIYNIRECEDIINRLLYDDRLREMVKAKQTRYINDYFNRLPTANDVMNMACQRLKLIK